MSQSLLLFAITEFFLSLSPGPAVLLVVSQALHKSGSAAFASMMGIMAANTLYFILSAVGLGALLVSSSALFTGLKIAGCAYLLWMAYEIVRDVVRKGENEHYVTSDRSVVSRRAGLWADFFKAFLVQASSVKNLVIFLSIIPQFVDPSEPVLWQFVLLGLVSLLVEAPILAGYAIAASALGRISSGRASTIFDLTAALLLVVIAVSVALGT
ncbi:LysE family translocator [Coralliovum pocilloporae]|uniref:LysE family translocator n=1 Tax=Coralliovum pocilloporae TaxID=3066369 RepID=UPI003306C643